MIEIVLATANPHKVEEINVDQLKSMDAGVSLSDALNKNATLKNNNNQNGG